MKEIDGLKVNVELIKTGLPSLQFRFVSSHYFVQHKSIIYLLTHSHNKNFKFCSLQLALDSTCTSIVLSVRSFIWTLAESSYP